jgi:hypothetical protein
MKACLEALSSNPSATNKTKNKTNKNRERELSNEENV